MARAEAAENVLIRSATPADIEGILACLSAAFAPFQHQYTPQAYLDTILNPTMLQARMNDMQVLVAEQKGKIVGTVAGASVANGEGHLRGMAVLPDVRGSGVAAQLLGSIESRLQDRGCYRITLDTTEPLFAAMRFYEKNGYERSGAVADFFGMPLIEYSKQLPQRRSAKPSCATMPKKQGRTSASS